MDNIDYIKSLTDEMGKMLVSLHNMRPIADKLIQQVKSQNLQAGDDLTSLYNLLDRDMYNMNITDELKNKTEELLKKYNTNGFSK